MLGPVEEPERAAPGEPTPPRRLAWSTAIFAAATGLSRILGLVREIVARNYFGVRGPINAFEIAFLIPNTVRALVADAALSSAFVPVFSELLEKGERARAWRVASTLFWLIFLGLGGVTVLFILLAPWIMAPFPYEQDLLVGLSQTPLPDRAPARALRGDRRDPEQLRALHGAGAHAGLLEPRDHPRARRRRSRRVEGNDELYVYAGAILAATLLQFLLPIPWLRGLGGRLQFVLDWRDPAVKRVFVLMVPVTLGLGLINVNALIDGIFAAQLIDPNIAPSAINAAFRIYMLPQGMFSVAVATVLFPRLSRLAARGDVAGFRETVSLGLGQIGFLLIPASAVAAVLAVPDRPADLRARRLHGRPDDVVAGALAAFTLGLTFNGTMLHAEPRVLQPPVAVGPDRDRAGQPRGERGARRRLLPLRHLGDPARDVARQHGGHRRRCIVVFRRRDRADGRPRPRQVVLAASSSPPRSPPGSRSAVWYGLDALLGRVALRPDRHRRRRPCRRSRRLPRSARVFLRIRELECFSRSGAGPVQRSE